MHHALAACAMVAVLALPGAARADCGEAEFEQAVTGDRHCLLMRRFGASAPRSLLVWLHADLPGRAPADTLAPLAREAAERFASRRLMSVALLRPGYPDREGRTSQGSHLGRSDHYTADNIAEVAGAIARLRSRFNPEVVVVVGHGGGAALAAVMLGSHPGVADAAVLVGCPCDLVQWRAGRRYWGRSEDPVRWIGRIPRSARVVALHGELDHEVSAGIARDYIGWLKAREVDARFESISGANAVQAISTPEVFNAIAALIAR